MAWNEVKVEQQRLQFINDLKSGQYNITDLCRMYDISRPTAYKWITRYEKFGLNGLNDQSRARKTQTQRISLEIEEQILEVRYKRPRWGPLKIEAYLKKKNSTLEWPSKTCIHNILDRNGLIVPRKVRRRVSPQTTTLKSINGLNDVWCADFKGWFLTGDGAKCEPFTLTDGYSRYLLRCNILPRNNTEHVWAIFDSAFREYGLPLYMRSDNGSPFGSTGVGRLCKLAIKLIKAEVLPEWISPGKPQENGRHERMHRTLKAEVASPPAKNLKEQRKSLADFQNYYNFERPHQSLNQETPGSVYQKSTRSWSGRLKSPEYTKEFKVCKVHSCGKISFHDKNIYIGRVLTGEPIGIKAIDDDLWEVYFGPILLGEIDYKYEFRRPKLGNLKDKN